MGKVFPSCDLETPAGRPTGPPFGVTPFYRALALTEDPYSDPIAAQFVPRPEESEFRSYESLDPIGDDRHRAAARLIHHYRDRALVLVHDRCAVYCRHCFRRHFTGTDRGGISDAELDEICVVLAARPRIREIILSGGDPLMLPDDRIAEILHRLARLDPGYIVRIGSRMPVVHPARITPELADVLGKDLAVWFVTQVNHPRELTAGFREAVGLLLSRGVPVLNQAVLLKGINDDADTLEELFRGLVRVRVKPYYLFQGDLAAGTAHFRTSIGRGLELMKTLRARISGIALPTYAVDLPGGAGKIPLNEASVLRVEDGHYILAGPDGREHRYPVEEDPCPNQETKR